jgi:hypothetical protein
VPGARRRARSRGSGALLCRSVELGKERAAWPGCVGRPKAFSSLRSRPAPHVGRRVSPLLSAPFHAATALYRI